MFSSIFAEGICATIGTLPYQIAVGNATAITAAAGLTWKAGSIVPFNITGEKHRAQAALVSAALGGFALRCAAVYVHACFVGCAACMSFAALHGPALRARSVATAAGFRGDVVACANTTVQVPAIAFNKYNPRQAGPTADRPAGWATACADSQPHPHLHPRPALLSQQESHWQKSAPSSWCLRAFVSFTRPCLPGSAPHALGALAAALLGAAPRRFRGAT